MTALLRNGGQTYKIGRFRLNLRTSVRPVVIMHKRQEILQLRVGFAVHHRMVGIIFAQHLRMVPSSCLRAAR